MPQIKGTIKIKSSPEELWSYLCNIEKIPEWIPATESVLETSDNPIKKGATFHERTVLGVFPFVTQWHVADFKPMKLIIFSCSTPHYATKLKLELVSINNDVVLTASSAYTLYPKFKLLGQIMDKLFAYNFMQKNLETSLKNIKDILEAHAPREKV